MYLGNYTASVGRSGYFSTIDNIYQNIYITGLPEVSLGQLTQTGVTN